jgi:hypothetical protein
MSEYSGFSTGYVSMVSAGGGLRPLASQFTVSASSTTTSAVDTATSTATTANTTNTLETTTGLVANVWA